MGGRRGGGGWGEGVRRRRRKRSGRKGERDQKRLREERSSGSKDPSPGECGVMLIMIGKDWQS